MRYTDENWQNFEEYFKKGIFRSVQAFLAKISFRVKKIVKKPFREEKIFSSNGYEDELMRKHLLRIFSLIKNESQRFEVDKIPPWF